MYQALAKHSGMSLTLKCVGDLWIDDHHTADKLSLLLTLTERKRPRRLISLTPFTYRTAPSLSGPRSKKLWEKSGVSSGTEQGSPLSMR